MKQFRFLVFLMSMLFIGVSSVFADKTTPTINVAEYVNTVDPRTEAHSPIITIWDGGTQVTRNFTLSYVIKDQTLSEPPLTNSKGAKITVDPTTNTSVEYNSGNIAFGNAGSVTIVVNAKSNSAEYNNVSKEFSYTIRALTPQFSFVPEFATPESPNINLVLGQTITVPQQTWEKYTSTISGAKASLPNYKITYTSGSGITTDITDRFNVSSNLTSSISELSIKNGALIYAGKTTWNLETEEAANAQFPSGSATITYTFTPKSEYAGYYDNIVKTVNVTFTKSDGSKQPLHLVLSREMIQEERVSTEADGNFCIHVYKYGMGDPNVSHTYQYFTPNPALLNDECTILPVVGKRTTGTWGDFNYIYKIESDETYYDDCMWNPFGRTGTIQAAGEKTGLTISDDKFQVSKPGLVKIGVYAALQGTDENGYGADLRKLYAPVLDGEGNPKVMKDQYGAEYTVYSEPVYFYIDVMKRIPTLKFNPDPSTMQFVVGDKIDMYSRFEVSGHITDECNGIEGHLEWGAQHSASETDHFAYTFFISDRQSQAIRINNWPSWTDEQGNYSQTKRDAWEAAGYDQWAYRSTKVVHEGAPVIGRPVQIGDQILQGDGTYIELTDANISAHSSETIKAGDKERGITYFSTKGYGEEFEKWNMEFLYPATYDITYTIRPWNHTRWDIGSQDADSKIFRYEVKQTIPTHIVVDPELIVANKGDKWNFVEPSVKVISNANEDVTDKFILSYAIQGGSDVTVDDAYITSYPDFEGHAGTYSLDATTGTMIEKSTGTVYIGNTKTGDINIIVSAEKKASESVYEKPEDGGYVIRIISNTAEWEITSTCRAENPDAEGTVSGKFHFKAAGAFYGGTRITGVPGIVMTVGKVGDDQDWNVKNSELSGFTDCCGHDSNHAYASASNVVIDDEEIPTNGCFFVFEPTVNGTLTVDANWMTGTATLITKDSSTGKISKEFFTCDGTKGEHNFNMPLRAGEKYYLYNYTDGNLHMHGFRFTPAFFDVDMSSVEGKTFTMFMNGAGTLPSLGNSNPEIIKYQDAIQDDVTYAKFEDGVLVAKKMTVDASGNIFSVPVVAVVKTTDPSLNGSTENCVDKTVTFYLQILDIPTYIVNDQETYDNVQVASVVRTTNIPTDMFMTFGGWENNKGAYYDAGGTKIVTDTWSYKSTGGAASRIASELADNDPTYNKTIDGFSFFNAAAQNPIDEDRKSALLKDTVHVENSFIYRYASGTEAEQSTDIKYNTTYRVPARGAYLKFEPRESGLVLLYIVQNGSVDFHYGLTNFSDESKKYYQVKWRPLYITDETGKPCEMVGKDDPNFTSAKNFLPAQNANQNPGYYTLGISRCSKEESLIEKIYDKATADAENHTIDNCSFDWSEFRGTTKDQQALLTAWKDKGQNEGVVKLDNGGFMIPHKAYVRYAFNVKAGKTYFVFQPGSKFEFGGFSFVPVGYPSTSTYGIVAWNDSTNNDVRKWTANRNAAEKVATKVYWQNSFTQHVENDNIDIYDCANATNEKIRSFTANNWTSICVPFSISAQEAERVFGKGYWAITADGVKDGNTLHFIRHVHGHLEAGRPYLIKPTQAGSFSFKNVTIEGDSLVQTVSAKVKLTTSDRFNVTAAGDEGTYTFKGVYNQENMPKGSFFAASDGLYRYNKDSKIGGYRAFFALPENTPLSAKVSIFKVTNKKSEFVEEDEEQTTGIMYVDDDNEIKTFPINAGVYSINGQKLGEGAETIKKLTKGIYIINGQKITVK